MASDPPVRDSGFGECEESARFNPLPRHSTAPASSSPQTALKEPAADLQRAGEQMTFAECDEALACIAAILNERLLNGETHAEMMRWKFRQLASSVRSTPEAKEKP